MDRTTVIVIVIVAVAALATISFVVYKVITSKLAKTAPVDCQVSAWTDWTQCGADCKRSHVRSVTMLPSNGGKVCPPLIETESCTGGSCKLDCQVSEWSNWSPCGPDCKHKRTRIITVQPTPGGRECPALSEEESCAGDSCACVVSPWSEWQYKPLQDGIKGLMTRTRTVLSNPSGTQCPPLTETASYTVTYLLGNGTKPLYTYNYKALTNAGITIPWMETLVGRVKSGGDYSDSDAAEIVVFLTDNIPNVPHNMAQITGSSTDNTGTLTHPVTTMEGQMIYSDGGSGYLVLMPKGRTSYTRNMLPIWHSQTNGQFLVSGGSGLQPIGQPSMDTKGTPGTLIGQVSVMP